MANFCEKCGAKLAAGQMFCTECGNKIESVPEKPEAAAANTAETAQPAAVVPQKQKKQQKQPVQKAAGAAPTVSVGAVLAGALISADCLPYLLKSLMFLVKKNSLGLMTVHFCDILGWAVAFAVVILGAKLVSGKWRLSYALFFTALLTSVRSADSIFLPVANSHHDYFGIFCLAADGIARLLCAVLLVGALRKLFSEKNCVQGGRIGAFFLCLFALFSTDILNIIRLVLSFDLTVSPMSTFALKLTGCFICAAFLTLAAKRLLKKQKAEKPKDISSGLTLSGVVGIVLIAFSLAAVKATVQKQGAYEAAARDVEFYIAKAEATETIGDMDAVAAAYKAAGEHLAAWKTVAEGNVYNVPADYNDDSVLKYLSFINRDTESLKRYIVTEFNEADADMWAPLMLHAYRSDEREPEEDEKENIKEHIKELTYFCIANECFVFAYPFKEDIEKEKDDIANSLELSGKYEESLKTAEVFAEMQRGVLSSSNAVNKLLDIAEEYPDSIRLQLLAGYMGSQNTWDSASHYKRTAEALLRCRDLWLKNYKDNSKDEEITELNKNIAGMLLNMKDYTNAIPLLEEAYKAAPEDSDVIQQLSNCYSMTDNAEKGFELTKKLYSASSDDVSVIFSYFLGALKNGGQKEAAGALSRLADTVRGNLGENEDHRDEILFSAVLYFSLNDDGYWTDYSYRVYDDENTDKEVLKILKGNEFLYDYVRAVYWEKNCRDPEKALPYAEKALSAMENSGRLHYLKGMILYDSEKFKEALEEYKKADSLEPDDPSVLFALANTYDALEEYKTAYSYCDKALAHFPNGTDHGNDRYGVSAHANNLRSRLRQYVEEAD